MLFRLVSLDGIPEVISADALNEIIMQNTKRCESLEKEKDEDIPEVKVKDHALLGEYFKFVNREASINILIKHSAEQYTLYGQEGGVPARQVQWAACSGGPGLGKNSEPSDCLNWEQWREQQRSLLTFENLIGSGGRKNDFLSESLH